MLRNKTIIYAVSHSYPFRADGYVVRTSAIAETLVELGHRVIVVNRPGRLWKRKHFDASNVKTEYRHNGVSYLYFQDPEFPYSEIFEVYKPDIVIAASNHANAIPALKAAKAMSIHCIYEVRGFWELTRAFKDKKYANSEALEIDKQAEAEAANLANEVWTLNDIMLKELVARGVTTPPIKLLPNSLVQLPNVSAKSGVLRDLVGVEPSRTTLAYIGTFNPYEGLELLIDAVAACNRESQNDSSLQLVLIGSGAKQDAHGGDDAFTDDLKAYAKRAGVGNSVYFSGRLTRELIAKVYADIDLVINPRLASPVTNIVSSLKSIEAMAFAKPLILSDIAPHKLLNDEAPGGVSLFENGNMNALATCLIDSVSKIEALQKRALAHREWVAENRVFTNAPLLKSL